MEKDNIVFGLVLAIIIIIASGTGAYLGYQYAAQTFGGTPIGIQAVPSVKYNLTDVTATRALDTSYKNPYLSGEFTKWVTISVRLRTSTTADNATIWFTEGFVNPPVAVRGIFTLLQIGAGGENMTVNISQIVQPNAWYALNVTTTGTSVATLLYWIESFPLGTAAQIIAPGIQTGEAQRPQSLFLEVPK